MRPFVRGQLQNMKKCVLDWVVQYWRSIQQGAVTKKLDAETLHDIEAGRSPAPS